MVSSCCPSLLLMMDEDMDMSSRRFPHQWADLNRFNRLLEGNEPMRNYVTSESERESFEVYFDLLSHRSK
jgi:hypothetical protein